GKVRRKNPTDASVIPAPFSSDGSRRARTYAAKGVSTTDRPVRNAALDAVVSVWPITWRIIPAARRRPTGAPSFKRAAVTPFPRERRKTMTAARRNLQNRNASGGESRTTFLTTMNEDPQTTVAETRTASAASLLPVVSGASLLCAFPAKQIAYYRRL